MNSSNYYENKIKLSFKTLTEKIIFARNYIEDFTKELKVFVYTNKIIPFDEHQNAQDLIHSVRDDIMNTMREERYAIHEYILSGLVENTHVKSELETYKKERELYYSSHDYALRVLLSGNHHPRFTINTQTMKEQCSICNKKHVAHIALKLECGHEFGRACFNSWCDSCMLRGVDITCPNCRKTDV
jgi:hypothetical protein